MKTIHRIDLPTATESRGDNLWDIEVPLEENQACLRSVILRRPDAHPFWHDYLLSIVHLCPIDGQMANLHHEDSSHEIVCSTLDPDFNNQPTADGFKMLVPLNLVYQLRGCDDDQAKRVFSLFLYQLTTNLLSPDTDYRSAQTEVLNALCRVVKYQH